MNASIEAMILFLLRERAIDWPYYNPKWSTNLTWDSSRSHFLRMYFYDSSTLAQHTRHAFEAVHYSCFYSPIQIKSRIVLVWPFMVMRVKHPASRLVRPSKVINLTSSILVWPSIIGTSFHVGRHVIYVWSSDRKAQPSMLELYLCVTIWSKTRPTYPGIWISHRSYRATSPALTLVGKYS